MHQRPFHIAVMIIEGIFHNNHPAAFEQSRIHQIRIVPEAEAVVIIHFIARKQGFFAQFHAARQGNDFPLLADQPRLNLLPQSVALVDAGRDAVFYPLGAPLFLHQMITADDLARHARQTLRHLGKRLRLQIIVAVHKHIVPAGRRRHACRARRRRSAVLLVDDPHPRIRLPEFIADRAALVRGRIIHKNHLDPPVSLLQNTVHTLPQIRLFVVDRHNYADQRICPLHLLSPFRKNLRHPYSHTYSHGRAPNSRTFIP